MLILVDLGLGKNRLGGSALAQVYRQMGNSCPDLDDPSLLKGFFSVVQSLNKQNRILAYHDRSDGGLLAAVAEMVFASRLGVALEIGKLGDDILSALFNEELGAVLQVRRQDVDEIIALFQQAGLAKGIHIIGKLIDEQQLSISQNDKLIYSDSRAELQSTWSEVSYRMQALRDNPDCAKQQYDRIADDNDPGLHRRR